MKDDKQDILEEIVEMLENDGKVPQEVRDRLILKAIGEILRKIDYVESIALISYFKKAPVKSVALSLVIFALLHEFVTYININTLVRGTAKILGIPID